MQIMKGRQGQSSFGLPKKNAAMADQPKKETLRIVIAKFFGMKFIVSKSKAQKMGIKPGQELTKEQVEILTKDKPK